ncbi:hypothetical protein DM02DRAFT_516316 [Periconia macrospinosa]|uniref:Fucose-specific lectin n=1 Tax=Periconia macrospinosa TaxID=97972 RepID=A0A2V1E599_9PLEO|nr:hypothetical protein DM02DRAFT_516316 [Periconia macrospinosa]
MRKKIFFIVLAAIIALIILAVGLGAGLGVALNKKSEDSEVQTTKAGKAEIVQHPFCKDHPEYCVGGYLNAEYYSKRGAFNGSGIAIAGESWNAGQRRIFTLYFQHHSGDIRYMQYGTDQRWIGGNSSNTVATDAKNGTTISAVAYTLNQTGWFHIFYIGKDGNMKQMTQSNQTNKWEPGVLNAQNLKAYDSPKVGLQACWKGNFYGDSEYGKIMPGASTNATKDQSKSAINLWYASSENTFEQYSWINGQEKWIKLSPWQGKNGHAGVGCYSWDEWSSSTYTMMVNQHNDLEIWWRDTNATGKSSDEHPLNSWTNSTSAAINGVSPMAAMGYTTYFYTQMADLTINGYDIKYQSETTYIQDNVTFTLTDPAGPVKGLAGTHLTATAYSEFKDKEKKEVDWDSLYVFYQTAGDDITAFQRKISGGQWTNAKLQIPQE